MSEERGQYRQDQYEERVQDLDVRVEGLGKDYAHLKDQVEKHYISKGEIYKVIAGGLVALVVGVSGMVAAIVRFLPSAT